MVEGETEAALFARKKNRRKRLGEGADLHLERRIQSEVIPKAESTAATDPTAAADPKAVPPAVGGATESGEAEVGEPNADGEVTAATAATGDGAAGSVEGEGTGDAEEKPEDIKAALDAFEKQDAIGRDDPNPEPATNVVGMLGNLWSRIPDAPVRATHAADRFIRSFPSTVTIPFGAQYVALLSVHLTVLTVTTAGGASEDLCVASRASTGSHGSQPQVRRGPNSSTDRA